MHITILTYGSRGDIQPYIALGVGLQQAGHTVRLAVPGMFADWVTSHDMECVPLPGDIEQLSREVVDHAGSNPVRIMLAFMNFSKSIAEELYTQGLKACQDTDVVMYNLIPAILAHNIARQRGIPDIYATIFPVLTPTSLRPHALFPALHLGKTYNILSHRLYRGIHWRTTLPDYRTAQKQGLNLPAEVHPPFANNNTRPPLRLLGFSSHIVPHTPEWPDNFHTTGYWFLDEAKDWQPPAELLAFLDAGEAPVYIGFGSMVSDEMESIRNIVIEGLRQSGKRGVLLSGWGQLIKDAIGDDVFALDYAPHEWLFPRMAAVVHHGGAGTTATALRAGVPSVIIPFIADQPFWGRTLAELGAGPKPISRKQLTPERLAQAIRIATTDAPMRQKAAELGAKIRAEDGITTAVKLIESYVQNYKG